MSLWPEGERGVSAERGGESWLLSLVGRSSSVEIVEDRKLTEVGGIREGGLGSLVVWGVGSVGLTRGER